jgi:hypothetical protein
MTFAFKVATKWPHHVGAVMHNRFPEVHSLFCKPCQPVSSRYERGVMIGGGNNCLVCTGCELRLA